MIDLILKAYQETNNIPNADLEQVISHCKSTLEALREFKDPKYFLVEKDIREQLQIFEAYKRAREENFQLISAK